MVSVLISSNVTTGNKIYAGKERYMTLFNINTIEKANYKWIEVNPSRYLGYYHK